MLAIGLCTIRLCITRGCASPGTKKQSVCHLAVTACGTHVAGIDTPVAVQCIPSQESAQGGHGPRQPWVLEHGASLAQGGHLQRGQARLAPRFQRHQGSGCLPGTCTTGKVAAYTPSCCSRDHSTSRCSSCDSATLRRCTGILNLMQSPLHPTLLTSDH